MLLASSLLSVLINSHSIMNPLGLIGAAPLMSFLSLILVGNSLLAQPAISLQQTDSLIRVDGILNESIWQQQAATDIFWQHFPKDSIPAMGKTLLRFAYNDQFLYVAVRCESSSNEYLSQSLKRDFSFKGTDNISLLFDPYGDQTNGFLFGLSPFGVQKDALLTHGGRHLSTSWDNKWQGEAQVYPDHWTAEFAIPFNILRFEREDTSWRFNCYRFDSQYNETSSWIAVPRNRPVRDLSYMGELVWERPPPSQGIQTALIPYLSGGFVQDQTNTFQEERFGLGGDAKIQLGSGIQLDLTLNPDFSQVEVDQQIVNLSRFEIRLPERRKFFLENADLFGGFGFANANPFFTRQIGVRIDPETGQNIQEPILSGARLSGMYNEKVRLGLLNMQTAPLDSLGLPGINYSMMALQRKVFARSNLAFLFVNKRAMGAPIVETGSAAFNRVAGIEYLLATRDNYWSGKAFYHHSLSPKARPHPFNQGIKVEYERRRFRMEWEQMFVGEGFEAELGFIRRRDYFQISPEAELFFYPKKGGLNEIRLQVDYQQIRKPGQDGNTLLPAWGISDWELEIVGQLRFNNNARFTLKYERQYVFLMRNFDPTRVQEQEIYLPAGTAYQYQRWHAYFRSDRRKRLYLYLHPHWGSYFGGHRAGITSRIHYRFQLKGSVSLDFSYNYLSLATPFHPTHLWLIGPKLEWTFSRSLFFSALVQYNSQRKNLNLNTRLQWRFAPVSDLYLVYTDNYLVDPSSNFEVRNRALMLKLTYWLNL